MLMVTKYTRPFRTIAKHGCPAAAGRCAIMSTDDEVSPAMQFTRSVRRVNRRPISSPADSENFESVSPPRAHQARQQQLQPNAVAGVLRNQLLHRSLPSPLKSVSPQHHQSVDPLRPVQPNDTGRPSGFAMVTPPQPMELSDASLCTPLPQKAPTQQQQVLVSQHPLQLNLQQSRPQESSATDLVTPQPLNLHDPYTPWLRTTSKSHAYMQELIGTAAAVGLPQRLLLTSPISTSSSSSRGIGTNSNRAGTVPDPESPKTESPGSALRAVVLDLSAEVAEFQLAPRLPVPQPCQHAVADDTTARGLPQHSADKQRQAAAAVVPTASSRAAAVAADTPSAPSNTSSCSGVAGGDGDDSDDETAPLTLGRRTQPRLRRRPVLLDRGSSSSSDNDSACSTSHPQSTGDGGLHSPAVGSAAVGGSGQSGPGGASELPRFVTPGSIKSPLELGRACGQPSDNSSSSSRRSRRRQSPIDTGYTGVFDFDLYSPDIQVPEHHLQQQQQLRSHGEPCAATPHVTISSSSGDSECSPGSPLSSSVCRPVALSFSTPECLATATATATPSHPVPSTARRLSHTFLGQGLALQSPILKQHRHHHQHQQQPQEVKQQQQQAPHISLTDVPGGACHPKHTQGAAASPVADCSTVPRPGCRVPRPGPGVGKRLGADALPNVPASTRNTSSISDSVKPPGGPRPGACTGVDPSQQRQESAASRASASSRRAFAKQRQQLAQQLYEQWNMLVFEGQLPLTLPVVWNPRLTSAAGRVVDDGSMNSSKTCSGQLIPVRLELSAKVLDNQARLLDTLAHEMCHVAAWTISKDWKAHHGAVFKKWARLFEQKVPGIKITTCHEFEIYRPFRWQCANDSCGKLYLRHKRSIDITKHRCGCCQGRLNYLGKFSHDGKLIAGSATPAGAPGAATPGCVNAFASYVKTHFANTKRALPNGTPHKEVMTRLAAQYKQDRLHPPPAQEPVLTRMLPTCMGGFAMMQYMAKAALREI